jgi:ankyrin repeat protein
MAKVLLDNGADPNIQDMNGNTAIIAAAQRSQALVELLLSKGADLKIKNNMGTTAF